MTDSEQILRSRVCGFEVNDFYEFCAKFNIPKTAARKVLRHLDEEGFIELVWKSPRGARFYVKRGV